MRRLSGILCMLTLVALTAVGCHHETGDDDQHVKTSQPTFGYIPIVASVDSTGSSQVGGGNKITMTITLKSTLPTASDTILAVTLVDNSATVPNGNVDTGQTNATASAVLAKAFGTSHPVDAIHVDAMGQTVNYTYPSTGSLQPGSYTLVVCAIEKPTSGGVTNDWYSNEKAIPVELK